MNRKQYMAELAKRLKKLPDDEIDRALQYFEEYFEEAGADREREAIESLGTPQEAAEGIIRDIAIRRLEEPAEEKGKNPGKRFSTLKIVFLSLAAFPATLAGSVLMFIVSAAGMISVIAAVLFLLGFVITGIGSVGVGLWVLTFAPASGMVMLGWGLMLCGGEWLFFQLLPPLFAWFTEMVHTLLLHLVRKGGKKRENV